jgi:hypothetical protein
VFAHKVAGEFVAAQAARTAKGIGGKRGHVENCASTVCPEKTAAVTKGGWCSEKIVVFQANHVFVILLVLLWFLLFDKFATEQLAVPRFSSLSGRFDV